MANELLEYEKYPHPTPTQSVEVLPGTQLSVDVMSYTVVKGEQDFQPFERITLLSNGGAVGIGQVTTYAHNRISDITEVNFLIVALALPEGDLVSLGDPEVAEDFIDTTEATFLLSGEPHHDEDDVDEDEDDSD